jgi:hypothetical protein
MTPRSLLFVGFALTFLVALPLFVLGCDEQVVQPEAPAVTAEPEASGSGQGGQQMTATVKFGRVGVGSPFPPPDHDASFHAYDAIRPRTAVIRAGGTVTFEVAPFHYPAIYEDGTRPEDINTDDVYFEGDCPIPLFEDEEGRIAEGPLNCPSDEVVEWSYTFEEPGLYLVICQMLPHFVEANMYSWVRVR